MRYGLLVSLGAAMAICLMVQVMVRSYFNEMAHVTDQERRRAYQEKYFSRYVFIVLTLEFVLAAATLLCGGTIGKAAVYAALFLIIAVPAALTWRRMRELERDGKIKKA